MLRCADGSYYVGYTDNLERRINQHQAGDFFGYTYNRRPVELVWSDHFKTRAEAMGFERQIKGWRRDKKEALIAGDWVLISRLSRSSGSRR